MNDTQAAAVRQVIAAIPHSWLDPLLTGPDAVIGHPPYACPDIERLLRAIRQRVAAGLEAALGEAPASPWRDIATAPKDGTRVLLWNGYRRALGWSRTYADGSGNWHRQNLLSEPLGSRDIDPETHWMPLPDPPKAP